MQAHHEQGIKKEGSHAHHVAGDADDIHDNVCRCIRVIVHIAEVACVDVVHRP